MDDGMLKTSSFAGLMSRADVQQWLRSKGIDPNDVTRVEWDGAGYAVTVGTQPAGITLRGYVSVPNWSAPYNQTALRELAEGMRAAADEADRLVSLIPDRFRSPSVQVRPRGTAPGWEITVSAREPWASDDEDT